MAARLLLLVGTVLAGCTGNTRKLDEVVFHRGPEFRLKLVRYHENLPLHYVGEVYRVQCASARTTQSPAHKTQDAGWVTIGNGGAIGSTSAAGVLERVRHNYHVINPSTLVWTGNGLQVSFDACGRFQGWYPTALPPELVEPIAKPEYCAPAGTADCRHYDFLGDRAPRFERIDVHPAGRIGFVARSPAIRPAGAVRVESVDSGRTWTVTPVSRSTGAAR